MKGDLFQKGARKLHSFIVDEKDLATFQGQVLHRVCSTYKLGQEMEWSSRLFMLDLIDEDEEGVGTMLHIEHLAPAFVGDEVEVIAIFDSFEQKHLLCDIEVKVGDRWIAKGRTGQRLLSKDKLQEVFKSK